MMSDKNIQLRSEAIYIEYFHKQLHKKDKVTIGVFNYSLKVLFQQHVMRKDYIVIKLNLPIPAV
jgi:hypothetical protein